MDTAAIGSGAVQANATIEGTRKAAPVQPEEARTAQETTKTSPPSLPQAEKPVTEKSLTEALKRLNDFVGSASRDLEFARDKETDIQVVKVIDRTTKEVIRQMPSEEVLQIAKVLDKLQGLLVRDKV